jgi:ribose transport system permease protein
MLLLVQGLAFVVSNGEPVNSTDLSFSLDLTKQIAGPFTPSVLLLLAAVALVHFLVTRMGLGREIVAIGGNRSAAEAAGIPVRRRIMLCFVISGTIAGIAGAEQSAALLSGSPIVGSTDLLTAAAACFLGGVALTGGRGSAISSLLAVIALAALANGLELSFINAAYQQVITGVVLVAVAAPALAALVVRRRRAPSLSG